jgi:hypothetical protein
LGCASREITSSAADAQRYSINCKGDYMKAYKLIVIISMFISILLNCKKNTSSFERNENKLTYLTTKYSGCNGQGNLNNILKSFDFMHDTVYYSINKYSLKISIGHNYICCAPFKLFQHQENNNLIITLCDTCNDPYVSCYCRCNCYYKFDVYYANYHFNDNKYLLKVFIHDPRQLADSLIHQLIIK